MMMSQKRKNLRRTPRIARKMLNLLIKSRRISIREIHPLGRPVSTTEISGASLEKQFNAQVLSGFKGQSHVPNPQSMRSSLSAHALPRHKDLRPTHIQLDQCNHPITLRSEQIQCLTACPNRLQVAVCLPSIRYEAMATWAFGAHNRCRAALLALDIHLQVLPVLNLILCIHRSLIRCSKSSRLTYLLRQCLIRTIKKLFKIWSS